jgi:hypothetical protein
MRGAKSITLILGLPVDIFMYYMLYVVFTYFKKANREK